MNYSPRTSNGPTTTLVLPVLLLALFAPMPLRADEIEPARLIPPAALVYVELTEPGAVLDHLLDPALAELIQKSPDVQRYYESGQYRRVQEVTGHVEAELGNSWQAALRELAGSLHFAVEPLSQRGLLIVRAKDAELLSKTHTLFVKLAEEEAARRDRPSPLKSKEYQGITAWSVGDKAYMAVVGDLLILSNHSDGLRAALDRVADQDAESLADTDDFRNARQHVKPSPTGWGFVRWSPVLLLPQVSQALSPPNKNAGAELLVGGILDTLRRTPVVAGSLHIEDNTLSLRAYLPHNPSRLSKVRDWYFPPETGHGAFSPLRLPGTLMTLSTYRDVSGLWQKRDELFDEATVAGFAQADTQLGLYFAGRDFGSEVLGALTPRMQIVAARQEFAEDTPVPAIKLPAGAVVFQMKEPKKAAPPLLLAYQKIIGIINLVGGMQGQPQLLLSTESYNGATISKSTYLVDEETDRLAAPIHYNASPACAQVGDRFVFGSTVGIVRQVVDALAQDPTQKPAAENDHLEFDLAHIAAALDDNRQVLVSQNMLEEGNSRQEAEEEISLLFDLLGLVDRSIFRVTPEQKALILEASVQLRK